MRRLAPVVALLVASWSLAMPMRVVAHPFGPFSISVYSGLTVHEDHVDIRWVLDMAETAATTTVDLIDADRDGQATDTEVAEYLDLWVGSILSSITLVVDNRDLLFSVIDRELTLPAGEGGVPAVRLVMDLTTDFAAHRSPQSARYEDTNYASYPGWREVAVAAGEGITLIASSAPPVGRTNELTVYPADLGLSIPTSEAEFTFTSINASASHPAEAQARASGTESGFAIWPTGVLAGVLVCGLIAILVAINRPPGSERGSRRR
jgi:hypothetical protein